MTEALRECGCGRTIAMVRCDDCPEVSDKQRIEMLRREVQELQRGWNGLLRCESGHYWCCYSGADCPQCKAAGRIEELERENIQMKFAIEEAVALGYSIRRLMEKGDEGAS